MNDYDLDSTIDKHVQPVDDTRDYDAEDEEQAEQLEQNYTEPSRWWFSSTGIPLVAGTVGPISSAFSICALVQPWRMTVPSNGSERDGTTFKDPAWLLVVNAISLVIAIFANVVLLLNMARRISTVVSQPLTVLGWYTSSFLLVGIVSAAGARLRTPSPPEFAWTQAYYYGLLAAVLYFVIATMMLVTLYSTWRGHHGREFRLTNSQRTLMLQTIFFLSYVLLGAIVFSHVEGWEYLETVYWCIVTLLTVGFGDFAPATRLGRGLYMPYAIGGIIFIGLVIGSIRSLGLDRGKQKIGARLVEKSRQAAMDGLRSKKRQVRLAWFATHPLPTDQTSTGDLRRQEFQLMRRLQHVAARQRRWTALGISLGIWLLLWLGGAAVFRTVERKQDWTYFESVYFAFTALITIGYGDYRPQSNAGTALFVLWSLLAVPSLTVLIGNMSDTIVKAIRDVPLRLGEVTILPRGQGIKAAMQKTAAGLRQSKPDSEKDDNEFPGGKSGEDRHRANLGQPRALDCVAKQFQASDKGEARTAAREGDAVARDTHERLASLMRAMSRVIQHLDESPPHEYTFEEWHWYLDLVGEEVVSTFARVHDGGDGGGGDGEEDDAPVEEKKARSTTNCAGGDSRGSSRGTNSKRKDRAWGWLTKDSPLMGDQEEARWLLERLATAIETQLKRLREESECPEERECHEKSERREGRKVVER